MPLDPKTHVQIITSPDAFLKSLGVDPKDHFVDHHGRAKPIVVRHADGVPTHTVEDDGSLAPFVQLPDPNAPPVEVTVTAVGDPAEFKNA